MTDLDDIDPNQDTCPWCYKRNFWKGRHASAKHPEKWERFKAKYEPKQSAGTEWVEREAENQ